MLVRCPFPATPDFPAAVLEVGDIVRLHDVRRLSGMGLTLWTHSQERGRNKNRIVVEVDGVARFLTLGEHVELI